MFGLHRDHVVARLREILLRYPSIKLAYLFGSYARGDARPLSDLDIAVIVESPGVILDVSAEISKALNIDEDRVSIVDMRFLDPLLILKIVEEGVEIVNRGVDLQKLVSHEVIEVREVERGLTKIWLHGNPLDVEVLRDLVGRINEDINDLEEILGMDFQHVIGDKHLRRSFERVFQTLLEGCIDLLRHVIAGLDLGVATYYRDYVEIAERSRVISSETAHKLKSLIPIRHLLVHRYRRLNYEELWRLAREAVETARILIYEIRISLRRYGAQL